MRPAKLLRPDRLRTIERPFAWLPCRLLTGDLLHRMSTPAKLLYLHLALAADRRGLSFWGDKRIQHLLSLPADELHQAREQLTDLDLLAFDGHTYQLLSLPKPAVPGPGPQPAAAADAEPHPDDCPAETPEDVRLILRRLLGRDFPG